jgi:hypothetical protein
VLVLPELLLPVLPLVEPEVLPTEAPPPPPQAASRETSAAVKANCLSDFMIHLTVFRKP